MLLTLQFACSRDDCRIGSFQLVCSPTTVMPNVRHPGDRPDIACLKRTDGKNRNGCVRVGALVAGEPGVCEPKSEQKLLKPECLQKRSVHWNRNK